MQDITLTPLMMQSIIAIAAGILILIAPTRAELHRGPLSDPDRRSRPLPERVRMKCRHGLRVGHATDTALKSGVTVFLPDQPAIAAVHVAGGAPASRETELLRPENTVERVDALVLSGGSAFGLAAADGAMQWLAAHGTRLRRW